MKGSNEWFMRLAEQVAKEAECGAVLTRDGNLVNAYSNRDSEYAYISCIKNGKGDTLFLTHGVNSRNAMEIIKAGVKRVYFKKEFGIGAGTQLLRAMGVKVCQISI